MRRKFALILLVLVLFLISFSWIVCGNKDHYDDSLRGYDSSDNITDDDDFSANDDSFDDKTSKECTTR